MKMNNEVKKFVKGTDFMAIATAGKDGVHLVSTWGGEDKDGYVIIINDETLAWPAGGYKKTEENLMATKGRMQLLVVLRQERNGYRLEGKASFNLDGETFEKIKEKFNWARAALVLKIEKYEKLL